VNPVETTHDLPPPRARRRRSHWEIQRAVIFSLLMRELKTRFGGRWLGFLWVLSEPVLHVTFLMVAFAYVRARVMPGVDYVIFLITGLVPFMQFKAILMRMMDALDVNRGLLSYRQVKPIDAMISRVALEIAIYAAVYLLGLGLLAWMGYDALPVRPLELMGITFALLMCAFGLGLCLAVLTDDSSRSRKLIRLLFFPLYMISCVVIPVHALPDAVLPWLLWNPLLHALEISRGMFMKGYEVIPQASGLYVVVFGLLAMVSGMGLYRVSRNDLVAH
jgi:capsular polysaccharide transport system permease protein